MADKSIKKKLNTSAKKTKKVLSKRYDPIPESRVGGTLAADVKGPKPLRKLVKYVKDSKNEVKKVTWPSRKESWRLTLAVLVFTAIFASFTTVVDLGFEEVVERLFL
jgi:preprotein translocase subunit SecE